MSKTKMDDPVPEQAPETTTAPGTEVERNDLALMVEGIFDVLGRYQAEPTDGVLSLLTAFMQGSDRVLSLSTPEETEPNREALLAMLDHARQFLVTWPQQTPDGWKVH